MSWTKDRPFQALALTGGGYRGLFTARALQEMEDHVGEPIGRRFDLSYGTSIGGIIALALNGRYPELVLGIVTIDSPITSETGAGSPRSVAAIYGIVFASAVPLSFADIEARLDISKGSVSQGLRVLREVGAVKEVSSQEDRAERFEPDLELRKMVQRFLENRLAKQLQTGGSRLEQMVKTLPKGRHGEAAVLRARVKQLQTWNSKARALLPIAKTFLKLGG